MHHAEPLADIVLLLAAAVCIVALFRRLRLSPILGYLAAGVAIGPNGFSLYHDMETTHAIGEFGVVFLLFVIGLELSFERLARMQGTKLAFGLTQVVLTTLIIASVAYLAGQSPAASIIIGGGLALSSTAIVLALISESTDKVTQTGRLALATLILQDLAVIPLLVLVPLLVMEGSIMLALGEASIKAVLGLVGIILIGRLLLRPVLHLIASHNQHELFTATTLLIVFGLAYVSTLAGLSPALGAFLGGLLVAETEFRPQVEADILPFKGLLVGLFFITVGMGINVALIQEEAHAVFSLMIGLILGKALIMIALALLFSFPLGTALHAGLLLAQGGEFAFVLLALAGKNGLITTEAQQVLVAAIALSMAATPFLDMLGRKLERFADRFRPAHHPPALRETLELREHVVIAGFGRVGRTVAQLLEAEHIPYVALDMDATGVGIMRQQGKLVYYGDAGRSIVLRSVGISRAHAVIITHNDTKMAQATISAVRALNTNVPIIARAHNIEEVLELERSGANLAVAEMFETSLQLGGALLKSVGVAETEINRVIETFRAEDYALARRAGREDAPPEQRGDFAI